jgi:hypothetical protein
MMWDELLAKPVFVRQMIPLEPGEPQPSYAVVDPPAGYRWETDEELRERIKLELMKK